MNRLNLKHEHQGSGETVMLNFDTRSVPDQYQCDYWQDAISKVFLPLACDISANSAFYGTLNAKNLAHISLVEVKGCGQHVERHSANIKHGDHDQILMSFVLGGKMGIEHNGREEYLNKGQFIFYDSQRPYDLYLDEQFDQLVLMLPRDQFQQQFGRPEKLCGYTFGDQHPLTSLLSNYAQDLFQLPDQATLDLQEVVLHKFFDLINYVTLDQIGNYSNKIGSHTMLLRIKQLIMENLDNDDLNIHDIAQNFKISPRYIGKLFQQEDTTFGRFLLHQRLKLSKKLLIQTHATTHKVNQIAYQCGFNDMSYFSREFKRFYGVSPSDMRKES